MSTASSPPTRCWRSQAPQPSCRYALYTVTTQNLPDDNSMLRTLPFVLHGLLRYRLIAERHREQNADEMVLSDAGMLVSVLLVV